MNYAMMGGMPIEIIDNGDGTFQLAVALGDTTMAIADYVQAVAQGSAWVTALTGSLPPGTNFLGFVAAYVAATGGPALSVARLGSAAAGINATLVKSSPGRVLKITGYNAAASLRYLKLYNLAVTPVPASNAAALRKVLPLPPTAPFEWSLGDIGLDFATGIAYAIVTGAADNDATGVTLADVVGLDIVYI